jgi:hypothetical protein
MLFSTRWSAICTLTDLGIASLKSRFSASAAGELDDACARQMRESLSLFRPVTNGGSIADAATLTAVGEKHAGTVGSTIRAADFHKLCAGYCFRLTSTVSDSVIYTSNEAALFRWPR